MRRPSRRITWTISTALFGLALALAASCGGRPGVALPEFSRKYQVTCQTCHTVAPRLNTFGLAFQANHFQWPGGHPPAVSTGLAAIPLSGLATLSGTDPAPDDGTGRSDFRTLELFSADGFSLLHRPNGGYFVDEFAATKGADAHPGDLADAFAALPVAGRRGQWALTAGQFTPVQYQYDPNNSLSAALPVALDAPIDGLALDAPMPGLRLDYFNNRGRRRADGDYLDVGVPFDGQLALTRDSHWDAPHGTYLHAFRRQGDFSAGVLGYLHGSSHLEGLLATYALSPNFVLLGAGAGGHDGGGNTRRYSVEFDYTPRPWLALTGRWDALEGQVHDEYPVLTLTVVPFKQNILRLTAETVQQAGSYSNTVYALVQL